MRQVQIFLIGCAAAAIAGCSSEAPSAPERNRSAETPTPAPRAAPRPEREAAASAEAGKAAPAAPRQIAAEGRRCGWLHNPTPANWWLTDRDGQWMLSTQGEEPPYGLDEMPDMSASGWVETNGHYGYGCACIDMAVDTESGEVLRIFGADPKPLAQCRRDKSLPGPEQ